MPLEFTMTIVELVDRHPVLAVGILDLGGKGSQVALVLRIRILFGSVFLVLGAERLQALKMIVGMGDEVLHNLGFKEELGINLDDLLDLLG